MKHILPTAAVALLSLDPLAAAAQLITAGQQGCPLDLSAQVAAEVQCGTRSTVAFAVEWYGAEVTQLERWFRLAGCGVDEAATEAVWVANRCQTRSSLTAHAHDSLQLRQPGDAQAGRLVGRHTLNLEARALNKRASDDDIIDKDDADKDDADEDNTNDDNENDENTDNDDNKSDDNTDDDKANDDNTDDAKSTTSTTSTTSETTSTTSETTSTTLVTSTTSSQTTTSLASSTSSNTYVVAKVSGTSTSIMTCMTITTTTGTDCVTHHTNHKYVSSCTTAPVAFPTCLPGLSCAFSQTTGALSCYEKGHVPVYGKIILAIMSLAAFMAVSAILTMCCRERGQVKRHRQAVEEKALLAAMKTNNVGVAVEEVGLGARQQATAHGDTVPLIREHEAPRGTTTSPPPHIVVSGAHTPTEGTASFPPGRYDPFSDASRHHEY